MLSSGLPPTTAITWWMIMAQIAGLLSAWMVRCSEGSRHQGTCQRLFLGALLLVGATTVVALSVGSGCWLSCSATLSIMVVATTCEFSRRVLQSAE